MFVTYSNAMVAIFSSIDTKRNILPIPFLYVNHSHHETQSLIFIEVLLAFTVSDRMLRRHSADCNHYVKILTWLLFNDPLFPFAGSGENNMLG